MIDGLLVGVGGIGTKVSQIMRSMASTRAPSTDFSFLSIDTDRNQPDVLPNERVFVGGFNLKAFIQLAEEAGLRSIDLSHLPNANIEFGAMAMAEIGKLALKIHENTLIKKFSQIAREAASRSSDKPFRIFILASLCGGTGAGVVPDLASLVRQEFNKVGINPTILGFGIAQSAFRFFLPEMGRVFAKNQRIALDGLRNESGGYDDFFVAVDLTSRSVEDFNHKLAEGILEKWILTNEQSKPYEPGTLSSDDGMLMLCITDMKDEPAKLLWSPNDQLIPGGSFIGNLNVFFVIPKLPGEWGERFEEFQRLLSDQSVAENDFQNFFERFPQFLTGIDYKYAVPQVMLQGPSDQKLRPDFMLVPFSSHFADIVELKRPFQDILVSRNRHGRFSFRVMQAISQLRDYRDFFEDQENREAIQRKYGFTAFRPHMMVIIGIGKNLQDDIVFRRVTSEFNVSVVTYDEILTRTMRILGFS